MLQRLFNALHLRSRLCLWGLRRKYLCPRGRHVWTYFGRSRVCRCCHREEWFDGDTWGTAPKTFAESRPSWHHTDPIDPPTIEHPESKS